FTMPSNTVTFIVPVVLSKLTKKSVPTTPATPAGVFTWNFPSALVTFCACERSLPYVSSSSVCCAGPPCLTTLMEDSDPTFSTDPSSSAMRARALACVLTTSSQSTTVFAEALIVLEPRAIFTVGITRETSPARWPGVSAATASSPRMQRHAHIGHTRRQGYGDFLFIGTLLGHCRVTYCCYWSIRTLSI